MRINCRLFLASMMVWLAVLLAGVQAQSANLIFSGNWNGVWSLGIPFPVGAIPTPYATHITTGTYASYYTPYILTTSSPPGCGAITSPVPLWGAGNIVTAATTTPPGFFGRNGCDLRGAGLRPAAKNNPGNPNPVAGQYGWGYGIANVTTAGTAPRAFTIPSNLFRNTTDFSQDPPQFPYYQFGAYVQRHNGAGNFGPGLGLPNTSYSFSGGTLPNWVGKLKHSTGPNQFGGTMRLLGHQTQATALQSAGGAYYWWFSSGSDFYSVLGGSFAGRKTTGYSWVFMTGTFPSPLNTTYTVTGIFTNVGFPWGTGTLTFSQQIPAANPALGPWLMTTQGYDNRTSNGLGNIKMVTAYFNGVYAWGGVNENELVLKFTPEPGRGVMLAAGALLLVGLVQLRLRRR